MFVKIPIVISTESEIYKMALKFCEKNKDISLFSTPEKVIENALMFGSTGHIKSNLDYLESQCEFYREEK